VAKRIVEHTETLDVAVAEERVLIERRPAGEPVPATVQIGAGDEVVEVPVMRERVTVVKEAVVREDVTVRKERFEHTEHVQETLREEQLQIPEEQEFIVDRHQSADSRDEAAFDSSSATPLRGAAPPRAS
jgi:uncharacterized protein (TIGR02271 family)